MSLIDKELAINLRDFQMKQAGLFSFISELKSLIRRVPDYKAVKITYQSGTSFYSEIIPALLIGRFFGKKLVLDYQSNKAESELEDIGRLMLTFLKLFSSIEVSSKFTANVFNKYGLKTEVVPLKVDEKLFKKKQISSVQPRIIMARRLERGNNISIGIKAYNIVKQKYPRAELYILGDGPQREWLEWMVKSENIHGVTFTGYLPPEKLAEQFSESDIYLNTSTIDGLPLSLLEALHCGLAVISTKSGEIPEYIQNGVNGLLVESTNYSQIADLIIKLVENPQLAAALSSAGMISANSKMSA
ncbi:MAG: glycosyltransferase [bacterium]